MKFKMLFLCMALPGLLFAKSIRFNPSAQTFEPTEYKNAPLKIFLSEYASSLNMRLTLNDDILKRLPLINFKTVNVRSRKSFKRRVLTFLRELEYHLVEDAGGWTLNRSKNMRYSPSAVYDSDSFPDDKDYISVVHIMKYPLGKLVNRSIRPFVSRYGRVVTFNDEKTLLFHERGDNMKALIKIAQTIDDSKAYEKYLSDRKLYDKSWRTSNKKKKESESKQKSKSNPKRGA